MTERIEQFNKNLKIKEYNFNEKGELGDPFLINHIDNNQDYVNGLILKPSAVFLLEIVASTVVNDIVSISEPVVGIFYDYDLCDQAQVVRWFPYPRTKEYFPNYGTDVMVTDSIESLDWGNDFLMIYDQWDTLPDWKTLRRAYEKTWTYYKSRDMIIDSLVNNS
jgi:hypothetical protein